MAQFWQEGWPAFTPGENLSFVPICIPDDLDEGLCTHEDRSDDVCSILDTWVIPTGLSISGCRDKLIIFTPVTNLLGRGRWWHKVRRAPQDWPTVGQPANTRQDQELRITASNIVTPGSSVLVDENKRQDASSAFQPHPCENSHHDGLGGEMASSERWEFPFLYTKLFCTVQARAVEI